MATLNLNKKPALKPLTEKTEEKAEEKSKGNTAPYADFISYLMNCTKVARMYSITTKSYTTHKVIGHYLCDIWEPIYCLSKQLTMEYGDLKGFTDYKLSEYENTDPEEYFEDAKDYIEGIRDGLLKGADHTVTSEVNKILKITNNLLFHIKMK